MSVKDSHDICDEITAEIKAKLPNAIVMIHTEPCLGVCSGSCNGACEIFDE